MKVEIEHQHTGVRFQDIKSGETFTMSGGLIVYLKATYEDGMNYGVRLSDGRIYGQSEFKDSYTVVKTKVVLDT